MTDTIHSAHGFDRAAFEKIILSTLSRIMDLTGDEIDAEVLHTLQRLAEFAGDDRAYAVLFSNDGSVMETVYEWCAPGVASVLHRLEGRTLESFPWFTARIRALETVQFSRLEDLPAEARLEYDECQAQGVRSLLLVPLTFRGEPVGFLEFVRLQDGGRWWDDQIDRYKIVGEILVTVIQRKHAEDALREAYQSLEQRVEERSRELERRSRVGAALTDILRVLNSNRALPEVLEYIVNQAGRLLKASATMIRRADLENQAVTTEASYNLPPEFEIIHRSPLYASVSDRILLSRRPVVISDLQATYTPMLAINLALDPAQLAYIQAMLAHFRSMLSVPLFIKDEIFGSLTFYFSEPRDFPEDDIQLAISLGDQAALAIENARLYREEHYRREEAERRRLVAESLRDIMGVLNSHRPLDDILHKIVTQAVNLLKTDAVAVYRLWRKERLLVIRASHGLSQEDAERVRIPVGQGIAGYAVLSGAPVAVSDTSGFPDQDGEGELLQQERAILEGLVENYRSFLSVPLVGKDETYGALSLYYREARSFSQEEIELAASFADQASLAIENARLRSQSEQNAVAMERNRLARDLHDAVTQTLFSASLIAEVLPRLWERNPEEGRRRLEELRQLSRGALAEMRTLLLELRPSALTEGKLSDLLRQLAEAVTGRARLPVHLDVQGEFQLEPDVQVALYRIAQEALNNIVKHSGATSATITLVFTAGKKRRVELSIQDNGRGFDPASIPPNHLGVGIMHERAQFIAARLEMASTIGRGTSVQVVWEG